jgi:hypothetical protein
VIRKHQDTVDPLDRLVDYIVARNGEANALGLLERAASWTAARRRALARRLERERAGGAR